MADARAVWDNSPMRQSNMLAYYLRLLSHGWGAVMSHARTTVVAVCSAIVGVIALAVFKINPSSQNLLRTIAGIAWPMLLLIGYFLVYVLAAPWKIHQQDRLIIGTLQDKGSSMEIVGAFELLAREAESLRLTLWSMRQQAGKDTDPAEYAVVSIPLDSSSLHPSDRSKWRWMHYGVWSFQQNYMNHREDGHV